MCIRDSDIGGCLDSIRNNLMETAGQLIHAINRDDVCTRTADIGSHFIQKGCHINNFRFLCGILNRRSPLRMNGSHHNVNGRSHTGDIQKNLGSNQLWCIQNISLM